MRGTLTDRDTDRSLLCLSLGACNLPDHIGVSAGGCPLCPRKRTSEPVSASTQQLRQLGDIRRDPSRLLPSAISQPDACWGAASVSDKATTRLQRSPARRSGSKL